MRRYFLPLAFTATATIAVAVFAAPPAAPPPGPLPAMPALAANWAHADRIELSHGGAVLELERRGQVWGLAREGGYPVRPEAAEALTAALLSLRLLRVADGPPDASGLGDPSAANGGTLVRVRTASGAVIGAVVVGTRAGVPYVRRPREEQAWVASTAVPDTIDAAGWADRTLPPTGPVDGDVDAASRQSLAAGLPFIAARPGPQVRLAVARTLPLTLPDGTATLSIGAVDGQDWLRVSGTSRWAARLAPYAFALPSRGPLTDAAP